MRITARWFKDSLEATSNEGYIIRENIDSQLTGYRYDALGLVFFDKNSNKILDPTDLVIGSIIDTQSGTSGQLLQDAGNSTLYAIRSDQSATASSGITVIFDADFNSGKPVVPPAPKIVPTKPTNTSASGTNVGSSIADSVVANSTKLPSSTQPRSTSIGSILLKNPPAFMPKVGTKDYEDLFKETNGASAKPGFNYGSYIAATRSAQQNLNSAVAENAYTKDKITGLLSDGASLGKNLDEFRFYNLGSGRLGIGEKGSMAISEISLANSLVFSDKSVDISSQVYPLFAKLSTFDGPDAKIYRLYNSAFNRFPDLTGFDYWTNFLASNQIDFKSIVQSFILSEEFSRKYGLNTSNQIFAEKLYSNILGRLPDAQGLSYWINTLDNGRNSRVDVLASFSESTENKQIFSQTTGLL